jgi:hypothetical protein
MKRDSSPPEKIVRLLKERGRQLSVAAWAMAPSGGYLTEAPEVEASRQEEVLRQLAGSDLPVSDAASWRWALPDDTWHQEEARARFLGAIGRVVPAAMEDLGSCEATLKSSVDPTAEALVRDWAQRWHLESEWLHAAVLKRVAFITTDRPDDLARWPHSPSLRRAARIAALGSLWIYEKPQPRPLTLAEPPSWDPRLASERTYRLAVENYVGLVKGRLASMHAMPVRQPPSRRDLEWLVKWQVGGMEPADIAVSEGGLGSTARPDAGHYRRVLADEIGKRVRELHRELGLPCRPRRRGRRPKCRATPPGSQSRIR